MHTMTYANAAYSVKQVIVGTASICIHVYNGIISHSFTPIPVLITIPLAIVKTGAYENRKFRLLY